MLIGRGRVVGWRRILRILTTIPVRLVRSIAPCTWLHDDHLRPHFGRCCLCCGCGRCCCCCCCCCWRWLWTCLHHWRSPLLVERRPEVPWRPSEPEPVDRRMDHRVVHRQTWVPRRRTFVRRAWHIVKGAGGGASESILVPKSSIRWEIIVIVEIVLPIVRSRGQSRRRAINVAQTVLIENIGKDSVFLGRSLRAL